MLRLLPILLLILAFAGCKDKSPAGRPSPMAGQAAPRMSPEMRADQAEKHADALEQAGISTERSNALRSEIVRQAPRFGFSLSDDNELVLGFPGGGMEGMPVTNVILEIELAKPVPESAVEAVRQHLERASKAVQEQEQRDKEILAKLERVDRGEVVGLLAPASDPVGDWQSLGETREGEKHFLVEHDDAYYKVLMLTEKDKRMTYHEFREGKLERNLSQNYEYNAENGQLTSQGASGGPPDAFYVMQLPDLPDRLFVRPVYETVFMFTVYKRVGNADRVVDHAAPVPPQAAPVAPK